VPARFAAGLLERGRTQQATPEDLRKDVIQQLGRWRAGLYGSLAEQGFRSEALGPYQAPEPQVGWFECWSQTNASASPRPRASINATSCTSDASVFIASDLDTGTVQISHSYVKSTELNPFQFANALTGMAQPRLTFGGPFRKWYTPQHCREDFVSVAPVSSHPPLRVMWCTQGYREFDGLYDAALVAVTQDEGDEALVSRLSLQAIGYDDAIKLGQRFLEGLQVVR
jgi:serine protease Do